MSKPELLAADAELKLLATGFTWTEGPTWVPNEKKFLFSDIHNNRVVGITEDGKVSVVDPEAEYTNGRTLDRDGNIIECSHGKRAVQRRFADDLSHTEVLVDRFNGVRLNSPNDVIVDSRGIIWFSDPAYGIENPIEGHPGQREYHDRWVFRFDEQTGEIWPTVTDMIAPNGLAFSPDESILYVCDTSSSSPENGMGRHIRAYQMIDGKPKFGRTIIEIDCEVPDGMRVDREGRIWSSSGDGVRIYTPEGDLIEKIVTPERVANLCWGGTDGMTLFMCATDKVYSIRTTTTDAAMKR